MPLTHRPADVTTSLSQAGRNAASLATVCFDSRPTALQSLPQAGQRCGGKPADWASLPRGGQALNAGCVLGLESTPSSIIVYAPAIVASASNVHPTSPHHSLPPAVPQVPSYKFLPLVYQVASRMSAGKRAMQGVLLREACKALPLAC